MKNRILVAILPVLACFALLSAAQAVSPPPPGAYPNFTTAAGESALSSLTSGLGNTGVGWFALGFNTTNSFNTAVGAGALDLNTADSNTAVGAAALLLNTTGSENVAIGTDALVFNTIAGDNNAIGAFALFNNDSSGLGFANFNNAHGRNALQANVDGSENNAFGDDAMFFNTTGSFNTAVGDDALDFCTTGFSNVAIGDEAGIDVVTGDHIICIGADVNGGGPFVDLPDTCYIGSIHDEPVGDPGSQQAVFVDADNVVGIMSSSRRYKHDVQPMDKASETLYRLKPVTFKYNSDKKGTPQYGLIAEEVAEVDPQLVSHNKNGELSSVHYEQINSMLLNEFLKEHKKVEELQVTVAQQQKGMEVLTAQLKEQAAQIQKVSAQIEMSKPATKVVVNKP